MRNHLIILFLVLTLLVSQAPIIAADKEATAENQWQTIWMQDQRIGYAHTTMSQQEMDSQTIVVSDTLVVMRMKRFGQTLSIRQIAHSEETKDGELLRFTAIMENPPNSKSMVSGHRDGNTMKLTTTVGGKSTTTSIPDMQGIKSSNWPEHFVEQNGLAPGDQKTFEVFEPQLGQKFEVTATRNANDDETERLVVFKQSIAGSVIETHVVFDENWHAQKTTTPLLNMEFRTATEQEALEPIDDVSLDLAVDTMIKVDGLSQPHKAKSITYRIRVAGTDPAEIFSATHTYQLKPLENNTVELQIHAESSTNNSTAPPEKKYLEPTPIIESDDESIRKLAERGAPGDGDQLTMAQSLTSFVHGYVEEKSFSTSLGSAVETARSRAGDCTEHAVLLAALLRAKEIPSRVVIGFVYSDHFSAFVGHMWTEAWFEGRWQALDATRPDGYGPGHIAVSTSSLSEGGNVPATQFLPVIHLLGRTEIDVLKVVDYDK